MGLKDHIEGSDYAVRAGFSRVVLPFIVSATVKTSCSASMLPTLLSDPAKYLADMRQFAARFGDPGLPPRYAWLEKPVRQIASLFSQILAVGKMTASR